MRLFTATLLQPTCQGRVEGGCGLLFQIQTYMTVEVERHGDAAMSQHGLHHLRRHPLLQEPRGEGVACIVQPNCRQASLFQGLAKVAVEGAWVDGITINPAKYQAMICVA